MITPNQTLLEQIRDEAQTLPENLMREVLDFIGYLRTKYDQNGGKTHQETLLATFGTWQDERNPEKIIQDIYESRTSSER